MTLLITSLTLYNDVDSQTITVKKLSVMIAVQRSDRHKQSGNVFAQGATRRLRSTQNLIDSTKIVVIQYDWSRQIRQMVQFDSCRHVAFLRGACTT